MRSKSKILPFLLFLFLLPLWGYSSDPGVIGDFKYKLDSILEQDSLKRLEYIRGNLRRAKIFLDNNQLDSAIRTASNITEYDINLVPAEFIAEGYFMIGKAFRLRGNQQQALKNYWITIQKLKHTKDFGCRSEVYQELGHMYFKIGLVNKSIEKFTDAYRIEIQRNNIEKQIELLQQIIDLNVSIGNYNHAVIYQENLLRIYNKHDEEKIISLMKKLAQNYMILENYQAAINLHTQIREFARKKENLHEQLASLLEVIRIYYTMPDYGSFYNLGIHQFDILYNRQDRKSLTAPIKKLKAEELMYQGDFSIYWADINPPDDYYKAISYYDSALQIYNEIRSSHEIAITNLKLAEVYIKLDDFRTSIEYSENAISKLENTGSYEDLMRAYETLSIGYAGIDRFKWAFAAQEKYISYKDSLNQLKEKQLLRRITKSSPETEKTVFQNFEQFFQKELDTLSEALLRLDLENYKKQNELLLTESELKNAVIRNQELKQLQDQQEIELYKGRLEAEKQQKEIAMLQVQMKESELEIQNRQQQQKLKEQQIEALEQEKRIKNAELQKSEAQKIILILSILISITVLIFVIAGYINSRKLNQKIAAKNILIEENNQKLKQLNEEKNRLIKIVAHDLKNPLTSALTMAGMIKKRVNMLQPEDERSFALIRKSLRRMQEMINKILDVKAIDTDKINMDIEAINVQQVVRHVIELYSNASEKKSINITEQSEEVYALADHNYFIQIIENLLSNAIKFSKKNTSINIKIIETQDHCRIIIKDQGPGFNENDLQNLFRENHSLSAKPTNGEDSNGMGLSIVKKFVIMMGGKVWCESEPGKGTSFYLEFNKAFIPA